MDREADMARWQLLLKNTRSLLWGFLLTIALPAQAQIVPDLTLGTRAVGVCNGSGGVCSITNGAPRGRNLFHSFQQFSLPRGGVAAFQIAPTAQNVIVRVTGVGQPFASNINGTIATSNPANFFLLNPNGILFGSGAALNIGGSFLATTADRVLFNDGTEFRTTDPTPLLTINVPIGLGFTGVPKDIEVRSSFLSAGDTDDFASFALVGGSISLDDALIKTPGQRVELAGVGAAGTIRLNFRGTSLSLDVSENLARSDVTLSRISVIDVAAGGGGDIAIHARNIGLSSGSLNTGIGSGLGITGNQAGDITLDATGAIALTNGARLIASTFGRGNAGNVLLRAGNTVSFENSGVFSRANSGAIGNGGNIDIQAESLVLTNNSRLDVSTRGRGNAGNIRVRSLNSVSFDSSNAGTGVEGGVGRGGSIDIQTGTFSVMNGARLIASTLGRGDAGNVVIQADSVSVLGSDDPNRPSTIRTSVDAGAVGNGGNIQITTGTLQITDGAQIGSGNASGFGNAGNVSIQARDRVSLTNNAVAFSAVQQGFGNGGNIEIQTGSLFLTQGSQLLSGISSGLGNAGNVTIRAKDIVSFSGVGQDGASSSALASLEDGSVGKAGNVDIQTGSLFLDSGAQLASGTAGRGDAGTVTIRAEETVSLSGANTTIFSNIAPGGIGKGGNVNIQTGSLLLSNGAALTSSTSGIGNAGDIVIQARDTILLDKEAQIRSVVFPEAVGNGGNVQITTGSLRINNNGSIGTLTVGAGNAGNVYIQARDAVSLEGANSSIVTTTVFSNGRGGDITLSAASLVLNNRAKLVAGTYGRGNAGNITIQTQNQVLLGEVSTIFNGAVDVGQVLSLASGVDLTQIIPPTQLGNAGGIQISASSLRLDRNSVISTITTSGNGGDIQLNLRDLVLLRRNSTISTTAGLASAGGDGGNIFINAPKGFIVAVFDENSDIIANAFTGNGGRIDVTAQGVFGTQFRPRLTPLSDITASSEFGINGLVSINTPNIDPSRGLVALPMGLVDSSNQIAQGCQPGGKRFANSFVTTGRGGLPSTPTDPLMQQSALVGWVKLPERDETGNRGQEIRATSSSTSHPIPQGEIVEAQGWTIDAKGDILLVAAAPSPAPAHPSLLPPLRCPES